MEKLKRHILHAAGLPHPEEFLAHFIGQTSQTDDDVIELIGSFDESQQRQLWDALSPHIISATIQDAASEYSIDENATQHDQKISLKLIQLSVKLATITISQQGCIIPQSLFDSVLLLHGYVMSVSHKELQEPVACLCEAWWLNGIEGRDALTTSPLVYLLEKCLLKKPKYKIVKRLWCIREALGTIEHTKGQMIWDLVLNLFTHNDFLRNLQAQKFLSHIMATQPVLLKRIHSVIKYNLAETTGIIAEIYGHITLKTWENCKEASTRSIIEIDIIQDLMYNCIHIHRSGSKSLHSQLMKYTSKLHSRKSVATINTLLINLYKPFLWRSMRAANADVRANATELFFAGFPLVDTQLSRQQCESSLQQQFDLIFSLLEDEDHVVRQVAVTGVCKVLSAYSDQIPVDVSSDLLNILFSKLAWDQGSADVRVAVIQGISLLVENHNTYAMLPSLMPTLSDLLHDKADKVRMAFVRLLLRMKHIRAFKIWKIVSKEHVFARLEVESTAICMKLVQLTYKSFINDDMDNNIQLERCIELIESGLERARKFYRYAVVQMNLQQAVNYMLLLRKCIMACVSKHTKNGKENRKPSLCTTLANLTMAANKTLGVEGNFTLIDNHLTMYSMPGQEGDNSQQDTDDEEELSVNNTLVMRGLLDITCIIWAGFKKELDMRGNDELKQVLADKFSRALVEFFPVFEDEEIQQCLLYLASFLPAEYTSALRRDATRRLKELSAGRSSKEIAAKSSNIVLCLTKWGLGSKVLDLLIKCSAPLASPNRSRRSSRDGGSSDSSLRWLVHVANEMLRLPHYLELMEETECFDKLVMLCQRLHNVKIMCVNSLGGSNSIDWDIDLLISLFTIHSKLVLTIYQKDPSKLESHIQELCSMTNNSCVKHLNITESREKCTPHSEPKKPRRLLDLQETILQQSVNSNNSIMSVGGSAGDPSGYNTELAVKLTQTILTVSANYVSVGPPQTVNSLKLLTNLFKLSDTICSAGIEMGDTLTELLLQVTKASVISRLLSSEPEVKVSIQNSWTSLLQSRIAQLRNVQTLTGKTKFIWISLLQSMDLLPDELHHALLNVISTSMLSLIGSVDITATLTSHIETTIKSSKPLQQFVISELKAGAEGSSAATEAGDDPAVGLLVKLAERV